MKYTVTFAHLKEIGVKVDDLLNEGAYLGTMGDTGWSSGIHAHVDVVEGIHLVRDYTMDDIYSGNPVPSKTEVYYFASEGVMECEIIITTHYNSDEYFKEFKRHHPGIDFIPVDGSRKLYWNRTFTGRVAFAGNNQFYGNHIMVVYDDLDLHEDEAAVTADLEMVVNKQVYKTNQVGQVEGSSFFPPADVSPGKNYRYIKARPENIGFHIGKTRADQLHHAGINGTFFWYQADGLLYPTSILVVNNRVFRGEAEHWQRFKCPQSVLCFRKDGKFEIVRIEKAAQLFDGNDVRKDCSCYWAVGGLGLISDYGYDPAAEGFKKAINQVTGKMEDHTGVMRKANHTTMGVDEKNNVYLVRHYNSSMADCIKHLKELGCILAINLDGGGSTQMVTPEWIRKSLEGRYIANAIMAMDLEL